MTRQWNIDLNRIPPLLLAALGPALIIGGLILGAAISHAAETPKQKSRIGIANLPEGTMLRMRERPGRDGKVLAYIPRNSREIEFGGECSDKWCRVWFRGLEGWAFRRYLDLGASAVSETAEQDGTGGQSLAFAGGDLYRLADLGATAAIEMRQQPGAQMAVVGAIPAKARGIENRGRCVNGWCLVRYNEAEGWVPEKALVREEAGSGGSEAPAPPETPPETVALPVPAGDRLKTYAITGILAQTSLSIRSEPDETATVVGAIPHDAKAVEGFKRCEAKWCLVRYQGQVGWILRRHLADNSFAEDIRMRPVNLALSEALIVRDAPEKSAGEVGLIPSYANGIVRVGECGKDWCHIRYLGIVGWVEGRYLSPER